MDRQTQVSYFTVAALCRLAGASGHDIAWAGCCRVIRPRWLGCARTGELLAVSMGMVRRCLRKKALQRRATDRPGRWARSSSARMIRLFVERLHQGR